MKNRTSKKQAALRVLSFILAIVIVLNLSSTSSFFIVNAEGVEEETISEEVVSDDNIYLDLPDSAELEAMYIYQLLYGGDVSVYKDHGRDQLTGDSLTFYDYLREKIEKIANGDTTDTKISYKFPAPYNNSAEFKEDFSKIIDALLFDLPHAFYWYDKVKGTRMLMYGDPYTGKAVRCDLLFSVSENYADKSGVEEGCYVKTNPDKINSAKTAVANAQAIANECSGLSDYEKIQEFKKRICNLTEYNHSAADNASTPYGDPWQLVYVFDGDPSTNVVCEGYAKAFQYLCDLSGIDCYTVTGEMSGGTGAGGHMWNIVMLRGKSYLVDITNCDDGSAGSPDKLLLKGAAASDKNGCTFTNTSPNLTYTYDEESSVYPEAILKVSTEDFSPDSEDLPHNSHGMCVRTSNCPDDTHENIEWKPWEGTADMPLTAGNYYLTADVTLSESWVLPHGETNLCLYGHTITFDGSVANAQHGIISITDPADTLSICDCAGGGKITGGTAAQGGAIYNNGILNLYSGELSGNTAADDGGAVYSSGTFNMYGGKITLNTTNTAGCGAVYIASGSTFKMYGGEIKGNTSGSGVYIGDDSCNVTVGEAPVIKDNGDSANPVNLYLPQSAAVIIDPDHPLRGTAYIGITTEETPADGSPVTVSTGNADNYGRLFHSDKPDCKVVGSGGTIQLAVRGAVAPHSHSLCIGNGNTCPSDIHGSHTEIDWTPWESTDSLPNATGSYYLTDDVTLSAAWEVPEGETSLCLNGHTITVDSAVINDTAPLENGFIYIKDETVTFNLCDCTGEGIITGGVSKLGGAVYSGGTFNMFSGEISGNTSNGSGGAVYNDGTFNMYGGEISNNISKIHGSGVENIKIFNMYGGIITQNTCNGVGGGIHVNFYRAQCNIFGGEIKENRAGNIGGAIYGSYGEINIYGGILSENTSGDHGGAICNCDSSFKMLGGSIINNSTNGPGGGVHTHNSNVIIGGSAVIKNNTGREGGKDVPDDLYLMANSAIQIDGAHPFTEEAYIGIRTHDLPTEGTVVSFTQNGSEDDLRFFISNNPSIEPTYRDGKMHLKMPSHAHAICVGIDGCPDVGHADHQVVEWTRWSRIDSLPDAPGYYFLGQNVSLTDSWEPVDGVYLCLNGNTITLNKVGSPIIRIPEGVTFNLCNCRHAGGINGLITVTVTNTDDGTTTTENPERGKPCIENHGAFTMYGGKIYSNTATAANGGGVFNDTSGTFNMYGGDIRNNIAKNGGGVYNLGAFNLIGGELANNTSTAAKGSGIYEAENASLKLGGNVILQTNNANLHANNLYLCNNALITLDRLYPLKDGTYTKAYIGIITETEPHDDAIILSTDNDADYSDFFHSDVSVDYEIITNGDSQLQLMKKHPHNTEFISKVQPKCEECGYEEHYRCTVCGKLFYDQDGDSQILSLSDIEIEPTGHSWGEWQADDSGHWKNCENLCGLIRLKEPHIWNGGVVTLEPTDQTDGEKVYTCQICGHTKTEILPKLAPPETEPPETEPPGTEPPETEPPVTNPTHFTVEVVPQGRIFKSAVSSDYTCRIVDEITNLADNLLKAEEIALLGSGSVIELRLTVDKLNAVSAADGEAIEKALNGYELCQNLDINLYKIIDGASAKITKTNSPIAVEIEIPETLRISGREFAAIRLHDGTADMIQDDDNNDETVTFVTDRFSVYALVYKDKETSGDKPLNTGDSDYIAVFLSVGVMALAVSAVLTAMGSGIGAMSEVSKDRIYYKLIRWGRRGGKIRRITALALIFLLLSYYYGIGMHQYESTELITD